MGKPLRLGPFFINPINTPYIVGISHCKGCKGLLGGVEHLGYHPKGTMIFPIKHRWKLLVGDEKHHLWSVIVDPSSAGQNPSVPRIYIYISTRMYFFCFYVTVVINIYKSHIHMILIFQVSYLE